MSVKSSNMKLLITILDKYKIKGREKRELLGIIKPIYLHPEFQRRFGNDFPHHGNTSISRHIIEDAIKTYLLSKMYVMKKKNKQYDMKVAIYIALFHDLYTVPWQNNKESKVSKFRNVHGFRHPVEAVINAYNWYPDIFRDNDMVKLIDGIVHHMYPLPVIVLDDNNDNVRELKNFNLYKKLPKDIKDILIENTHRNKLGYYSVARSKYKEGRIMAKADKYVSVKQLKNLYDVVALVTGRNKGLKK